METGSISFTESSSSSPPNSSSQLNGRKVYFQDPNKPADPAGSTPSHRRKTKGAATLSIHGGQTPRCQVEGCKVDLSDAKAYYSRHKVCGTHSKSSLVIVSGIEQRFCQQCSKSVVFLSLMFFLSDQLSAVSFPFYPSFFLMCQRSCSTVLCVI